MDWLLFPNALSVFGLCLFAAGLCSQQALGIRLSVEPREVDAFIVLVMYNIGLSPGAEVWVNLTNTLDTPNTELVLLNKKQSLSWHTMFTLGPDLPGGFFNPYFISQWRQPFVVSVSAKLRIEAMRDDVYFLGVMNPSQQPLRLTGTVGFENPHGQPLALQQLHLADTLWLSSVAFMIFFVAAALLIIWSQASSALQTLLMLCIWLKLVAQMLGFVYLSSLEHETSTPARSPRLWQFVSNIHAVSEVLVMWLASLGWQILRPRLSQQELQFTFGATFGSSLLALLMATDQHAYPYMRLSMFFAVIRVVCYLLCICATNLNLRLIETHLADSPMTPPTALLYERRHAYYAFRHIFLIILFWPSVLGCLNLYVLSDAAHWATEALDTVAKLVLYATLLRALRPGPPKYGTLSLLLAMRTGRNARSNLDNDSTDNDDEDFASASGYVPLMGGE